MLFYSVFMVRGMVNRYNKLMRNNQTLLAWFAVLLGCTAITSIVFIFFKVTAGSFLPAILPEIQSDLLYYLVQAKEVLDGFPMLGNPYIIEHSKAQFPGLLLPIWLTALPGFLGVGINTLYVINVFFYSILLGGLLFIISKKCTNNKLWLSVGISILGLASLHNLMIRPAIMQTVYPAFALFVIALLGVLKNPHSTKQYIYLGLITSVSFYLYPYLWMITFTAVGMLILTAALQRNWGTLQRLLVMEICILAICIPQILTTISLFTDAGAHELQNRIGLVETHRIHPLAIVYAKYTFMTVGGLLLLRTQRKLRVPELLTLLLTASLLIATYSNLITGKELHFDTHFWRIGMFINIIGIAVFAEVIKEGKMQRAIAGTCIALLLLATVNRVAIRMGGFAYLTKTEVTYNNYRDIQLFETVFDYFNDNNIANAVIMAPTRLSTYIPLYTKNYVYYVGPARNNTISNAELLDRFTIQNIDRMSEEFLVTNIKNFRGWKAERESSLLNAYGGNVKPIDRIGGQEFIDNAIEQSVIIDREYDQYLHRYQVDYLVMDAEFQKDNPRLPSSNSIVFQTERFTIYSLSE